MDVDNKLLASYKISVHSTIGMLPSKISPSNIYSVWRNVNTLRSKIPQRRVKCKVGDLVSVTTKGKVCQRV